MMLPTVASTRSSTAIPIPAPAPALSDALEPGSGEGAVLCGAGIG